MLAQTIGALTGSEPVRMLTFCMRCGYQWTPNPWPPKRCAGCLSPYWYKERERKGGKPPAASRVAS